MNPKILEAMRDELEKIGGKMPALMSMGGLAGLTAVEGAGAFNKKHSKKERLKDGASAAFTGSILAGEAIHNKDMLKGGLRTAGKFLKRASVKEAELIDHMPEPIGNKMEDLGRFLRKHPYAIKKALRYGAAAGLVGGAGYMALKKGKKKEAGIQTASLKKKLDTIRLTKESAPSMGSMMKMHRLADAAKASKGTGAVAQAAPKLTRSAPREFDASHFGPSSGEKIELARQPNKAQGVMNRINKHFKGA